MPIEFTCPSCQKTLRVPDGAAGKRARCPDCGQIAFVPECIGFSSPAGAAEGATWSTGNWVPNEPSPDTGNPFASPYEGSQLGMRASQNIPGKIAGPAIGLIVVGILNLCVSLLYFIGIFASIAIPGALQGNQGVPAPDELVAMGMVLGGVFLVVARDAFIIYGAFQMKNRKSYAMALTASVLAIIPCNYICCLIDLPMAIWALVVLSDSEVKYAFESAQID